MDSTFYIVLNMRTPAGFESFGRFELGGDQDFAYDLFSRLNGTASIHETDILHMDLVELRGGLPVNVCVVSCTINEIADNCKIVTKELFKRINMI